MNVCDEPVSPVKTETPAVPAALDAKEVESYRQLVESLADACSSQTFGNSQPAHARVIFETFFERAQEEVDIFCQNLAAKVFNSQRMADNLIDAVKRGVRVHVFTQFEPEQSIFLTELRRLAEIKKNSVKIGVAKPGTPVTDLEFNFAQMDGRAYRFEPKKDDFTAFASMNNSSVCRSLSSLLKSVEACW